MRNHELVSKKIVDLQPMQGGFTAPWVMYSTSDGRIWLQRGMNVFKRKTGTISMYVWRSNDGSWNSDISGLSEDCPWRDESRRSNPWPNDLNIKELIREVVEK